MKYRMDFAYDGTEYGGWQVQPNCLSIQEVLEKTLESLIGVATLLTASGRTDAGVHATCQVAHYSSNASFSPEKLNALLPEDIRIATISPVPDDFHARYSVKRKIYHYHLRLSESRDPLTFRYHAPLPTPIDLETLERGAHLLLGTHDFSAFRGSGCGAKNPVKTLYRLDVIPEVEGLRLEFEGDGFLYKMVRNLVGTLLEIATHKRPLSALPDILASKDRRLAGKTAPPQGLFLHEVIY